MTSSDANPPRIFLRKAAWPGLLLAAFVLTAAGFADRQLKTAVHPGFLPADMSVYVYSADLPLSWLHLARTPLAGSLADEAAYALHSLELSLRQLTGIRPTPARWRTWLGPSAAAAANGRDWILCTRPGLVARAASFLFSGKALPGRQTHQAWREGYLLLSSSARLIDKALAAPPLTLDIPESAAPDTLVVEMHAPMRLVLSVSPARDLPVEARIYPSGTIAPREAAPWTAPPLAEGATLLLSLSGAQSAAQLETLLSSMNLPDFSGGILGELAERWSLNRLSTILSGAGNRNVPMSFALYGVSAASGVPLPQLAFASSMKETFAALLPAAQSPNRLFPYAWNGCAGWMFPIFGDQFSLYGFQQNGIQYLASRESLAAMLAATPHGLSSDIEDDLVVSLDWQRAAAAVKEVAAWAATRELLPETNPKDLEDAFIPVMNALSHCGTLHLAGKWSADDLVCQGVLTGVRTPEPAQ